MPLTSSEIPFDGNPSTIFDSSGGTTTYGGSMADFTNPFTTGTPEYNYLANLMAQQGAPTQSAPVLPQIAAPVSPVQSARPDWWNSPEWLSRNGAPVNAPPAFVAPPALAPGQQRTGPPPPGVNPEWWYNGVGPYASTSVPTTPVNAPASGGLGGLLAGLLGLPTERTAGVPFTIAAAPPQVFGFQGPFQGNIADTLARMGFPDTRLPNLLTRQTGITPPNYALALQQTGGLGLFSPQGFRNLGPTGQQYAQGLYETLAGIPLQDLLFASLLPFLDFQQGRIARTRDLGG